MENENNKPVTLQIRADEQTRTQFAELCGTLGLTQGAAMQTLLHLYELETAKGSITGSADVIDEVRSHADSIINAFIGLLERNQNADNRIRQEYAAQLDGLQKALSDYQNRAQQSREAAAKARQELDEVKAAAALGEKQAAATIAENTERAEHAERMTAAAERAAEDARKTAAALTVRVDELTAERDKLREEAAQKAAVEQQLVKARAEIDRLTAAAEIAAARAETEKAQAVSAIKDELRGDLDKFRDKLDAVKDELTTAKNELYRVTAERDEIKQRFRDTTKQNSD